jgi:hypothetical protein
MEFVNTKLVGVASTDAQTGPPTVRRKTALGRIRFRRGSVLTSSTIVWPIAMSPPMQNEWKIL